MYIHLGNGVVVRTDEVVAILDIETTSISKATKAYLAAAQKSGKVINVTQELPKSFVICNSKWGGDSVYISQISSQTLKKRAGYMDTIRQF